MNNREEFEKFCSSYGCTVQPEWKTFGLIIWQHQQEIIDELKAENFALSAMVCKHPDKRSLDENYDSIKDYCDMLEGENKKLEKKIETFQESTKTYLDLLRKEGI